MDEDEERLRVVRIFPDYGDSAIWFADAYPFDYADSGISPELRASFENWERLYESHVGVDTPASHSRRLEYEAEGRRLARALASEIGGDFEVEFRSSVKSDRPARFTGSERATNPRARNAFRRVQNDSRLETARFAAELRESTERGISFGWTAYAPNSDDFFSPDSVDEPVERDDTGTE